MITVAHLLEDVFRFGGTGRKLLYLTRYSHGYQMRHVFFPMMPGELAPDIVAVGGDVRCLDSTSPAIVFARALKGVRESGAQILFTHFTRSLICGLPIARLLGIPLVHLEHGPALTGPDDSLILRLKRYARGMSLRAADLLVANSAYTAGTVQQVYSIPATRLKYLYDPVMPRAEHTDREGEISLSSCSREALELKVAHVGGLIPVRSQITLIEAAAILRRQNIPVRIYMVGDGTLRNQLEQQTRACGVSDIVHFLGYRDDVAAILYAAEVYANPTVAEGFGIAVVEAMLAGLPVVLARGGAHTELIVENETGWFHEPGNAHDLAARLAWLWRHPHERSIVGQAGRADAQTRFAPERYARRIREIVDSTLNRHSKGTREPVITGEDKSGRNGIAYAVSGGKSNEVRTPRKYQQHRDDGIEECPAA